MPETESDLDGTLQEGSCYMEKSEDDSEDSTPENIKKKVTPVKVEAALLL